MNCSQIPLLPGYVGEWNFPLKAASTAEGMQPYGYGARARTQVDGANARARVPREYAFCNELMEHSSGMRRGTQLSIEPRMRFYHISARVAIENALPSTASKSGCERRIIKNAHELRC
jgi:hypothetical protein